MVHEKPVKKQISEQKIAVVLRSKRNLKREKRKLENEKKENARRNKKRPKKDKSTQQKCWLKI